MHRRPGIALFLDADFLLERAPELIRGLLELSDAAPRERPSSGSLRGPKMMSAITRMMTSSGMPMEPNIGRAPADRILPACV
jgi:hypothetical protein